MNKQHPQKLIGGLIILVALIVLGFWYAGQQTANTDLLANCIEENGEGNCYEVLLQDGVNHYAVEEYEESIPYFQAAQRVLDNDLTRAFTAYRNEANALYELRRTDEAVEIYRQLLSTASPETRQVYLDLTKLYQTTKEYGQALLVAEEAYEAYGDTAYLYEKAEILKALDQSEEEIAVYEQILELEPENAELILAKIERIKTANNIE